MVEFPQLSRVLHYRSTSQLIKYTALLHQVQLLMLHRQILLDIGQTAVSLLHHMNPADRLVTIYLLTYRVCTRVKVGRTPFSGPPLMQFGVPRPQRAFPSEL